MFDLNVFLVLVFRGFYLSHRVLIVRLTTISTLQILISRRTSHSHLWYGGNLNILKTCAVPDYQHSWNSTCTQLKPHTTTYVRQWWVNVITYILCFGPSFTGMLQITVLKEKLICWYSTGFHFNEMCYPLLGVYWNVEMLWRSIGNTKLRRRCSCRSYEESRLGSLSLVEVVVVTS